MANNQIIDKALAYLGDMEIVKIVTTTATFTNVVGNNGFELHTTAPAGYTLVSVQIKSVTGGSTIVITPYIISNDGAWFATYAQSVTTSRDMTLNWVYIKTKV